MIITNFIIINFYIRKKNITRFKMQVGILGDQQYYDEAKANSIPYVNTEVLKKLNRNKNRKESRNILVIFLKQLILSQKQHYWKSYKKWWQLNRKGL